MTSMELVSHLDWGNKSGLEDLVDYYDLFPHLNAISPMLIFPDPQNAKSHLSLKNNRIIGRS